ncbi:uncharacterized protein V1510DRAFT_413256 [Dipodascopsis tothii]|uniref:uncharacterized protein n=1 Tax=Dipodascopsis tothii TaxID=44089 RepID=UPI0034CF0EFC
MLSPSSQAYQLWSTGDPKKLLALARQIEANEGWRPYLTVAEHRLFADAIAGGEDAWTRFISIANADGRASPGRSRSASRVDADVCESRASSAEPDPESTANGSDDGEPEPVDTAMRVRYMLYERAVDYIFYVPDETAPEFDFSFLDEDEETGVAETLPAPPKRQAEESDYDDDDDDDDEKDDKTDDAKDTMDVEPTANGDAADGDAAGSVTGSATGSVAESAAGSAADSAAGSATVSAAGSATGSAVGTATVSAGGSPTPNGVAHADDDDAPAGSQGSATLVDAKETNGDLSPRQSPSADDKPEDEPKPDSGRFYTTLDTDRPLTRLKDLSTLTKADDAPATASGSEPGKLSQMNFGAANLSLKHLLAEIDDKRQDLKLSDNELRSLVSEVRKNRSKWASEERIGQEELYEAAEKVVGELRAYTEHSTAFLNKVNRRDAPNYFSVIRNPMDLSTVTRKLLKFQYKSKKEVIDDLMLIWSNCFEFNTDPNHYLRKHAMAMKKKTITLIPLIPDIVIKDKYEVEEEEVVSRSASVRDMSMSRDMSVDVDADGEDADVGGRSYRSSRKGKSVGGKSSKSSKSQAGMMSASVSAIPSPVEDERKLDLALEVTEDAPVNYDVAAMLPEVPFNYAANAARADREDFDTAIDAADQPSAYIARSVGLADKLNSNLEEMQQIRKICSKIGIIKQMQQQSHLYVSQLKAYNPEKLVDRDIDLASRLPGHADLPKDVNEACMQRCMAKVLMHAGYEDCQMLALEGIATIAGEYMQRLGRTMMLYYESQKGVHRYSNEDLVMQALYENGVCDLSSLQGYIRDDVDRFSSKLKDAHERMNGALADYLRPALATDNGDALFEDNSEEFISGGFSNDIGEDFFGFRDLGLDEELGLSSYSVPLHLLHSRIHASSNVQAMPVLQSKMASAPPLDPVTKDSIDQQIGLLRPFYHARYERFERDNALLEDEFLPNKQRNQRPKLPPTGRITFVKKRSSELASDTAVRQTKKVKIV